MPEFTFIEPHPDRLMQLLRPTDITNPKLKINRSLVQDSPLELFEFLEENDILFADSSHVSKTGSDVNFLFFEVFPRLQSGVYIHIHDIFCPFEYPQSWIVAGRAWNEIYLLHSFLEFNNNFQIIYFNHYMETTHREKVHSMLPSCLKEPSNKITIPGSIWIKKQ